MKALVGAFNQEKALVGAFSVIVQPVVDPMDRFAALPLYSPLIGPGLPPGRAAAGAHLLAALRAGGGLGAELRGLRGEVQLHAAAEAPHRLCPPQEEELPLQLLRVLSILQVWFYLD